MLKGWREDDDGVTRMAHPATPVAEEWLRYEARKHEREYKVRQRAALGLILVITLSGWVLALSLIARGA